MSQYAIDIKNQKVVRAMDSLGISPSELLKKQILNRNIEDFGGSRVPKDIQALRYDYHVQKLQETVHTIRQFIKDDRSRPSVIDKGYATGPIENRGGSISPQRKTLTSFMEISQDKSLKTAEKQHEILLKTVNQLQKVKTVEEKLNQKKMKAVNAEMMAKQLPEDKKAKMEKFKEKQLKKKQKLDLQQIKFQSMLDNKIKKDFEFKKLNEQQEKQKKMKKIKEQQRQYHNKLIQIKSRPSNEDLSDDQQIEQKLKDFEQKMKRSMSHQQRYVSTKALKARRLRRNADSALLHKQINQSQSENQRILQMIERQQEIQERKHKVALEKQQAIELKKQKLQERMMKAKQAALNEEKKQSEREKLIDKKIKASQSVIKKREKDLEREMQLRLELQKLKDEDKLVKVQRAKRVYDKKRLEVLEKQILNTERVTELKQEQQQMQEKHLQSAYQQMLEKEKLSKLIQHIYKSPNSQNVIKNINKFNKRSQSSETARYSIPRY